MTIPNSAPSASTGTQTADDLTETIPVTMSVGRGAGVSLAALSVVRDSLRVLSAFAWGKESRLSKKKSAQLCDLMNAWN